MKILFQQMIRRAAHRLIKKFSLAWIFINIISTILMKYETL